MELPTYTNIWRIEKRLYKLYDFQLPMPVPVGQIAVFAAIAVPYTVALTVIGLPFSHTLLWLYLLPPGALAWLATRPVLESKRLPELVLSQLRYLAEPRTWCRLAPLAEPDEITVTCRVWRLAGYRRPAGEPGTARLPSVAAEPAAGAGHRAPLPAVAAAAPRAALRQAPPAAATAPATATARAGASSAASGSGPALAQAAAAAGRPVVTTEAAAGRPLRVVERALSAPQVSRGDGWRDHVVVVPGGHRPGRPDQSERDRARAAAPLAGAHRVVVLGCTVGAGQTVTTLLTGEVLAALRTDQVAVLDLNQGPGSLAERAARVPALPPGARPGSQDGASRLEVISASASGDAAGQAQDGARMFELVSARYPLTIADPAASAVPRVLALADQLVLVAPASAAAAGAITMTFEWLEAHGRGTLAAGAVTVLNGVSRATMRHVEQAESVASGRCRAIVRVPWDDSLSKGGHERIHPPAPVNAASQHEPGRLSPAAVHAYTALAGVLVTGLAAAPELRSARI